MFIHKSPSWRAPTRRDAALAQTRATPPSSRFLTCLPYTLTQECPDPNNWSDAANFSDDPQDPGGATMCGIIQIEYDRYRESVNETIRSVRLITRAEGDAIYHLSYWQPHCPRLQVGLDLSFFDTSVNMGPEEATRILQVALGISDDGVWGPQTAGAAAGITSVVDVITAFTARRQAVYESFATFKYFGADWTRRTSEIGDESAAMAGAS